MAGYQFRSAKFREFWELWPSPKNDSKYPAYTRKGSPGACEKVWEKRGHEKRANEIIANTAVRKKYDAGWLKSNGEFLYAPTVYLGEKDHWQSTEWADIRGKNAKDHFPGDRAESNKSPTVSDLNAWIVKNKKLSMNQIHGMGSLAWGWLMDENKTIQGVVIPADNEYPGYTIRFEDMTG